MSDKITTCLSHESVILVSTILFLRKVEFFLLSDEIIIRTICQGNEPKYMTMNFRIKVPLTLHIFKDNEKVFKRECVTYDKY